MNIHPLFFISPLFLLLLIPVSGSISRFTGSRGMLAGGRDITISRTHAGENDRRSLDLRGDAGGSIARDAGTTRIRIPGREGER